MSVYNIKVIQYPNGDVTVRKYSKPIQCKELENPYEEDMLVNPFTFEPCKEVDEFVIETKFSSGSNEAENAWRSANRTKQKVFDYAKCANWEWFVTFTLSPEKIDRYDYTICSKAIRKWLNNQRRNAPDLHYLIVPEQHKDGAWHFHGVLANTGRMKFIDSGKRKKGRVIYNMSAWSYGFSTATAVGNINAVSKYIGKYITKSICDQTKGKQRYFVSSGIPLPDVSTFLVEGSRNLTPEEYKQYNSLPEKERVNFIQELFEPEHQKAFYKFMSTLTDSLGLDVVHVSQPRHEGSFVDVDYYELQERADLNDSAASV